MAYVIRLQKRKSDYAVIVIDHKRAPKSGKIKSTLGYYNPHTKKMTLNIQNLIYQIRVGVKLTNRIDKLLINKFNLFSNELNM